MKPDQNNDEAFPELPKSFDSYVSSKAVTLIEPRGDCDYRDSGFPVDVFLGTAKQKALSAALSNLKQLQLCWHLYTPR